MAQQQAGKILQSYPQARVVLEQTLEQEAIAKIALNQQSQLKTKQNIEQYNQAVNGFNNCLRSLNLSEHQLPIINQPEMTIQTESKTEVFDDNHKNYNYFSWLTDKRYKNKV